MKRLRRFWRAHWQLLTVAFLGIGLAYVLLFYKLGSLNGGLSDMELQVQQNSSSWHNIVHDPLNLPLKSIQWLILTIFSHHGQTVTRLPSALFGIMSIALFAYILRRWYGVRTAILGGVMFAFSGTLLHASRLASFDIMYLWGLLMVIAMHITLERTTKRLEFIAVILMTALVLYIPGMIWLVALDYVWQWRTLIQKWKDLLGGWTRLVIILSFLALLVPLGWSWWQSPQLVTTWLGLPKHFATPLVIAEQFAKIPWYIFVRQPLQGQQWLNGLPVLDVFSGIMFGLGAYFYIRHWRAPRSQLLLGFTLIGAALFAIGGPVSLTVLLPILYVVLVAGVAYLLHEWLRVFPFNPLARAVGIIILTATITTVCLYHSRAYFVAWPHTVQAIALFHNRI